MVRAPLVLVCSVASAVLAAALVRYYELSVERVVLLAPAIVLSLAAAAALLILWTRAALESIRGRQRRP